MPERVLIAVAWPYANGPLHLGHVAGSLLPPDIFARYHRMKGNAVLMVSGSDMHGTPITVKAEQEGVPPEELARRYHEQHKRDLAALAIDFGSPGEVYGPWGLFTSTATENHASTAQDIFRKLLAGGHIARRTMRAPYDPTAKRFLPDRYVEGTCPHCGFQDARGDQCDRCGRTLDPQELKEPRSKISKVPPEYRDTEHFFLLLPRFEGQLKGWSEAQAAKAAWRANTINFTRNWLAEGLKDRAITRDMSYGVRLPPEVEAQAPGFRDKRIYVWFEAVIGYLSAAKEWAQRQGAPDVWKEWWLDPEARHYYFLGKDNIPFHTIIWPAMLLGYNEALGQDRAKKGHQLPWDVPANEFMTFSGSKFSKSRGNVILVSEITPRFQADAVRYYLTTNMPDARDADFLWEEFVRKVNDELVAALGNFCHRTVTFAHANFEGAAPRSSLPPSIRWEDPHGHAPDVIAHRIGELIERCRFKDAMKLLMTFAVLCNQKFQAAEPWRTVRTEPAQCAADIHAFLRLAKTLSLLMAPFLPRAAQDLWAQLGEKGSVHEQPWPSGLAEVAPGQKLGTPRILFQKIDPDRVKDLTGETMTGTQPPPQSAGATRIPLAEFQKLDLRVGLVKSVEPHPTGDKLYVLKVDIGGEERQLVAGLRPHLKPEELLGKRVVVVANLEPAKLRGVESQGMLLAAEDSDVVTILTTVRDVKPGSKVR